MRNSKYNAIILREPNKSGVLDNPYLYGMPILYPANRISGGSFRFEGRIYKFPINEPGTNCHLHGILHEMEFKITENDTNFVKCVFEELCLPENVDCMVNIAHKTTVPIAAGERLFGKWQYRELIEKQAVSIIHPDICHVGGIYEGRKAFQWILRILWVFTK